MIVLKGIAWNHTRGFVPMVATAQRYEELQPDVTIVWEKRSLQAFADAPLEALAAAYDLIVMDHPHTALAATAGLLLPFEDWVPASFLADQADNTVGRSNESYCYDHRQWTLATDAATPISTCRPDLMRKYGIDQPRTWPEVLELANAGFVTVAGFPVDVLMHSYTFCQALGAQPFTIPGQLAPDEVLAAALEQLRLLLSRCDPRCLGRNPIRTAEWMSQVPDDPRACYCPFAYGYSNYSRPGFSRHVLKAGGLVELDGRRLCSTLGGAGLAVSNRTAHPRACMDYATFCAAADVQRGVYFQSGGQPGHRQAWLDPQVNAASSDFFRDTLATLDEALLRPQNPGYMRFQDVATSIAHEAAAGRRACTEAARSINQLAAASLSA